MGSYRKSPFVTGSELDVGSKEGLKTEILDHAAEKWIDSPFFLDWRIDQALAGTWNGSETER